MNKEPKDNVFSYNIITKNVILSHKKNDRGIQILDKNTKKVVAYIPAPNLIDGNGNINYEDVHYNLVNKKNNIVLQIVVDEKYFENDELAYPVKIDPYMVWMDDYLAASGVWSVPFMADSTIINNHLVVSNNLIDSYPYNSENRVYIDTSNILTEKAFVGSGDTISNKYIEEAYLCIHESSKPAHYPTGTVQVKTVSEQWDSSTITWNTQPQISDECIAEFKSTGTEGEFHKLDISDWVAEIMEVKKQYPINMNSYKGVTPEKIIKTINEMYDDLIITTDVGQNQLWTTQYIALGGENQLLTSGGLGTMGYGLPAAIGAKIGNPDKNVICISGDGGVQMNIQEMATAVAQELPITICILNNGYLGNVRQWQELFFNKRYSSTCLRYRKSCNHDCQNPDKCCPKYTPDFVKLAESYEALGIRVTKEEEIKAAFEQAKANTKGPTVIEFYIDPTANVFPMVPGGKSLNDMIMDC